MKNEPIAFIPDIGLKTLQDGSWCVANAVKMGDSDIPLYTHPHPDNLGLAESIIKQQQAEIEALKAEKLEYAKEVLEALDWGNYAGDYFQQKHGWYDDVAKWNGIVDSLRKAQEK